MLQTLVITFVITTTKPQQQFACLPCPLHILCQIMNFSILEDNGRKILYFKPQNSDTLTLLPCYNSKAVFLQLYNPCRSWSCQVQFRIFFCCLWNHCICMTEYLLCNHNNCPLQERFLHNASTKNPRQTKFDLKTLIVKKV